MKSDRIYWELKPFNLSDLFAELGITGNVIRNENKLEINYLLQGDLSMIIIPQPKDLVTRKHELWQTTCLEFFLGIPNSSYYWEFNLSPTGDWNVYSFNNYRQGMKEETAFTSLPFLIKQEEKFLSLTVEVDLLSLINSQINCEIGITAVIESRKKNISYWGLIHPGETADFHRKDSFIIKL